MQLISCLSHEQEYQLTDNAMATVKDENDKGFKILHNQFNNFSNVLRDLAYVMSREDCKCFLTRMELESINQKQNYLHSELTK